MTQLNQVSTRMKAPPRQIDLEGLRDFVAKLNDTVAILAKDLDFIVNGNLDANNIRANSIETKNLKADSVTADKIMVNELSAITANLGHITAGLIEAVTIIGSYIATADGTYPRCEISSTGNLFGAYRNASDYVILVPVSGLSSAPGIEMNQGTAKLLIGHGAASLLGMGIKANSDFEIEASGGIYLTGETNVPSWNSLKNIATLNTLQQDLDNKADIADAGVNLTFDTVTRNLKMFNANGTQIAIVNIP